MKAQLTILLFFAIVSCKTKKDISSNTSLNTSSEKTEYVEVDKGITTKGISEVSKLKEIELEGATIIPIGKFIFYNGKFEGEAESIVIHKQNTKEVVVTYNDTTKVSNDVVILQDSNKVDLVIAEVKTKKVDRKVTLFSIVGIIVTSLFVIFVLNKIKNKSRL